MAVEQRAGSRRRTSALVVVGVLVVAALAALALHWVRSGPSGLAVGARHSVTMRQYEATCPAGPTKWTYASYGGATWWPERSLPSPPGPGQTW
ncbi:MAG TPA: hypothetical protein VMT43_05360, partial [Acidimicrobiales bacterium]|nr:hypothetical protein [Acidimicrobiales bacterium]